MFTVFPFKPLKSLILDFLLFFTKTDDDASLKIGLHDESFFPIYLEYFSLQTTIPDLQIFALISEAATAKA